MYIIEDEQMLETCARDRLGFEKKDLQKQWINRGAGSKGCQAEHVWRFCRWAKVANLLQAFIAEIQNEANFPVPDRYT